MSPPVPRGLVYVSDDARGINRVRRGTRKKPRFEYTGKDYDVVGVPDAAIVMPASVSYEPSEDGWHVSPLT